MSFSEFLQNESGLATIDWTVLLAALTGAGVAMSALLSDALGYRSDLVRGELQDPHFETDWVDDFSVPQSSGQ